MLREKIAKIIAPRNIFTKAASDKVELLWTRLQSAPGFDPSVNYEEYEKLYYTSPDAEAAISVIASFAVGGGIEFVSNDENAAEKCNEFASVVGLQNILQNDIKTHLIFGNAYNLIAEGENDFGLELQVLHPRDVKIKTDKYGRIESYLYDIYGVFGDKAIQIEPENMLHFRFNQIANNVYGLSMLHSAYNTINLKKKIELTTAVLAHRDAHRLLHAQVDITGLEAKNPKTGKTYAEEKIDAVNALLKNRVKEQDDGTYKISNNIVTDHTVKLNDLSASHDFSGVAKILEHLQKQTVKALKVPEVFLGIPEGSNRATSYNQLRAFILFIRSIQNHFAEELKRKLIPQLTDKKVDVVFKIPLKEDISFQVDSAVKLYTNGIADLNEARALVDLPPVDEEE